MNYIKSIALLGILLGASTSVYPLKIHNATIHDYKVIIEGGGRQLAEEIRIRPHEVEEVKLVQPAVDFKIKLIEPDGTHFDVSASEPTEMLNDRDEIFITVGRQIRIIKNVPKSEYGQE